jgi:uncharacterized protein YjbJ (UPF0337 family)
MGGKTDRVEGKIKEQAGRATGDEKLEAEGKGEQAKGNLKQGAKKLKEAVHDATR